MKIFLRQVRSSANTKAPQVKTLKALGLGKRGKATVIPDSPSVRGMIRTVIQWVEVKHV